MLQALADLGRSDLAGSPSKKIATQIDIFTSDRQDFSVAHSRVKANHRKRMDICIVIRRSGDLAILSAKVSSDFE